MLEKKSFKENFKTEIDKLKKLSNKDKLWYIKEYYGIQIFLIILVLVLGFSLFFNIFKKQPVFSATFLNQPLNQNAYDKIYNEFYNYANLKETKDSWQLNTSSNIVVKDGEIKGGVEYLAKINVMMAGNDLDTIITSDYFIEFFSRQDSLANLEEVLPKELIDLFKDKFLFKKGKDGIKRAYAINITDAPVIKDNVFVDLPAYFSIVSTSSNIDRAILFLKYLYNM